MNCLVLHAPENHTLSLSVVYRLFARFVRKRKRSRKKPVHKIFGIVSTYNHRSVSNSMRQPVLNIVNCHHFAGIECLVHGAFGSPKHFCNAFPKGELYFSKINKVGTIIRHRTKKEKVIMQTQVERHTRSSSSHEKRLPGGTTGTALCRTWSAF